MTDHDGVEEGSTCCQCGKDLGAPVWYRRECGGHDPVLTLFASRVAFGMLAVGVVGLIVWAYV